MSVALVLGGSDRLWQDIEAARAVVPRDRGVVACNDAITAWDGALAAAVTLHPERLGRWITARREAGRPEPAQLLTMQPHKDVPCPPRARFVAHKIDGQRSLGSSGLFAVKCALDECGFDVVVLCGVGMDPTPHFTGGGDWRSALRYRAGWEEAMPAIRGRVRSMSGWTREQLGEPTPEWVERFR